jgi:hypothetical protein
VFDLGVKTGPSPHCVENASHPKFFAFTDILGTCLTRIEIITGDETLVVFDEFGVVRYGSEYTAIVVYSCAA